MPAYYAHDRFGRLVQERVRKDLKEITEKYYPQFAIGLQGPDLFFFYRPIGSNRVTRYGNHLHDISALPFFEHGRKIVKKAGRDSAEYAYLLGFVCHYILDSECHPYVAMMIEETGVQHLEIEEEFEKLLLRLDGEDPVGYPLAELVPTDDRTAEVAATFYAKGITPAIALKSLKYLKRVKRLFTAPGRVKQGMINSIFKLTGHCAELKGLMNQRIDNPACEESNAGLHMLFDNAVDLAAEMMECLDESIRNDTPIHKRFDRDFK